MNLTDMTIEEMCTTKEKQSFDRKSAKIEATAIATPMIAVCKCGWWTLGYWY